MVLGGELMGSIIFYSILALVVVWFFYSQFVGIKGLSELDSVSFEQALSENTSHTLIDVREQSEVKQGKIKGAINIPLGQISGRLNEIPKNKPLFLYCRSGMRSKQAAKILIANGYDQVNHLKGGIISWKFKLL
jgi:rhodanese-related sulfurtransferase